MKQALLLFTAFTLLFLGCVGDDDTLPGNLQPEDVDLLTGLQLRDDSGAPIEIAGNPNIRNNSIEFFPNPALSMATVYSPNADIAQVWLLPAFPDVSFQMTDFTTVLANTDYSVETLSATAVMQWMPQANNFVVDLSSFEAGYYRVFYLQSDEALAWDNVYIDPQGGQLAVVQNKVLSDW